jgi:hypothetical protein
MLENEFHVFFARDESEGKVGPWDLPLGIPECLEEGIETDRLQGPRKTRVGDDPRRQIHVHGWFPSSIVVLLSGCSKSSLFKKEGS